MPTCTCPFAAVECDQGGSACNVLLLWLHGLFLASHCEASMLNPCQAASGHIVQAVLSCLPRQHHGRCLVACANDVWRLCRCSKPGKCLTRAWQRGQHPGHISEDSSGGEPVRLPAAERWEAGPSWRHMSPHRPAPPGVPAHAPRRAACAIHLGEAPSKFLMLALDL